RRQPPAGDEGRDRAVLRQHHARRPQPDGSPQRRLHVRERAAGAALRHPDVYGSRFRRVPVTSEARRGLLGQASILTVTSYPNRTSPVERGKWVLTNLLGVPPSPPPPNIPPLQENSENGKPRSLRERMEQHRKDPVCAGCHKSMDPIGFALENFDA